MRGRQGRGAARAAAVLVTVLGLQVVGGIGAGAASAHPLGNNTVNQYSGLRVGQQRVVIDHVLDEAEIPTLQTIQRISGGHRPADVSPAQTDDFRRTTCRDRAALLTLTVDGTRVPLGVDTAAFEFLPGQAGLSTLRLTCSLSAPVSLRAGEHDVILVSANDPGRLGWREMTAVGDSTTLVASSVPASSVSERLRRYPQDLLKSPDTTTTASVRVRPGGAAAPGIVNGGQFGIPLRGVDVVTERFQELVSGRFTVAVAVLGLLLSVLLGALHALSPGHGKTIMAAFLVGQRGRWKQVGAIGLTVTVTHTLGVLVLGLVLSASVTVAPQRLYPLLGAVSGLLVAALGVGLLRTRWRTGRALVALPHAHAEGLDAQPTGQRPHDHDHPHGHDHPHDHPHDHDHAHDHDHPHDVQAAVAGTLLVAEPDTLVADPETGVRVTTEGGMTVIRHRHGAKVHTHRVPVVTADGRVRMPSLIGMGLADGLVPSPSALVVLLGAIALGRAWFGVLLVLGYGVGMAATLIGVGLLLGRLRGRLERGARSETPRATAVRRVLGLLPVATSFVIIGVGIYLAVKGFVALRAAA